MTVDDVALEARGAGGGEGADAAEGAVEGIAGDLDRAAVGVVADVGEGRDLVGVADVADDGLPREAGEADGGDAVVAVPTHQGTHQDAALAEVGVERDLVAPGDAVEADLEVEVGRGGRERGARGNPQHEGERSRTNHGRKHSPFRLVSSRRLPWPPRESAAGRGWSAPSPCAAERSFAALIESTTCRLEHERFLDRRDTRRDDRPSRLSVPGRSQPPRGRRQSPNRTTIRRKVTMTSKHPPSESFGRCCISRMPYAWLWMGSENPRLPDASCIHSDRLP